MATAFVHPSGDPTWAAAASSLGQLFDPRRKAQIKMMGEQYRGQVLGNDQTHLENVGLYDENIAWEEMAADPSRGGMSPQQVAIARMGRSQASPQGLAEMIGKFMEQNFRQTAFDRASAGDQQGATNALFGVANGPVELQSIDGGYSHNRYNEKSPLTATSKTLAEIVTEAAQAGAYNANASQSYASADNSRASAAKTRDEMTNPGKYRAPGAAALPLDITPAEAKAIDGEVRARLPQDAVVNPEDISAVVSRAAQIYQQTRNSATAIDQAFSELLEVTPGQRGGIFDSVEPTVKRRPPPPINWIDPPPAPKGAASALPVPAPRAAAAPASTPVAPPRVTSQAEADRLLAAANAAIARGADPVKVKERLAAAGVEVQ